MPMVSPPESRRGCTGITLDIQVSEIFCMGKEILRMIRVDAEPFCCHVFTGCAPEGIGEVLDILPVQEHGKDLDRGPVGADFPTITQSAPSSELIFAVIFLRESWPVGADHTPE